ncbi:MAG: short-chain dehydrogenase [Rubrivivax sp. SCN 70-15]|nr:MAG: short-chain dehydrogenase [Rubrivivax sp. SCN 70-15]
MNSPRLLAASAAHTAPPARGLPLLRLGFRPFYLGAAAYAMLAVPAWVGVVLGWWQPKTDLSPLLWHAHEMLFGFVAAVIVGFLLTAARAWTGRATPRGRFLGALALLWLAARLAALGAPYAVYALLDLALLPIVAAVLADVLVRAGNRRNLPLVALLALLAGANLVFHLAVLDLVGIAPLRALDAGLALIVMIECVMAGRVVPAFTMSATPGLRLQRRPRWEVATLAVTALALAGWVFGAPGPATAVLGAVAAALHLWRLATWRPWVIRRRPILWVLHLAYAWLPIGLGLLALAEVGAVPVSAAVHALAVGATGGLIIGMITRTARGHTGRLLSVSPPEVTAYVLVLFAALLRVALPFLAPALHAPVLATAALAWAGAFALYLWVYTPWLCAPRLDGKDG